MRTYVVLVGLLVASGCSFRDDRATVSTAPNPCTVRGAWSTGPEADWVRELVEAGGYDVVAETGSALIVSGKGHEFFIWAAEQPLSRGMPSWRRLAVVRGVPVHGDRDVWRSWRAQGFTFWVQAGPRPTLAPAAGRLAPVVDASLRLPFRNPCRA